jgi:transposase
VTPRQLRYWLRRNEYTREGLAEALGVGRATVYRWLAQKEPLPRLVELALKGLEAEKK